MSTTYQPPQPPSAPARVLSASSEFMTSSSLVAKFAFLLLTFLVFIIALQLGVALMGTIFNVSNTPRLFDGMVAANVVTNIPQDPTVKGSLYIPRSSNQALGVEFTWSVWVLIASNSYLVNTQYGNIFNKGDFGNVGLAGSQYSGANNCPGLYLVTTGGAPTFANGGNTAQMQVVIDTFSQSGEYVNITNIPINKWVNVVIRCSNYVVDVFVNGIITQSMVLTGLPKQNYGDVNAGGVPGYNGFDGNISNLWYYNYALGTTAIQTISQLGPNTKLVSGAMAGRDGSYLSSRWFHPFI